MSAPFALTSPPARNAPTVLKWVGSKGPLAPHLCEILLPALDAGGRYYEPFAGSLAVFFALRARGWRGEALLSDVLAPLVGFWVALQQGEAREIFAHARHLEAKANDPRAAYYRERDLFNAPGGTEGAQGLARFLWLNHRGFNGLWRTNKHGKLSTSWGGERSYLPSLERLEEAGRDLCRAALALGPAWDALAQAGEGDVVYADPPYAVGFRYYAGSFGPEEQRRTAEALRAAWERGATVVASNSDTPEIRALYAWAEIRPVSLTYTVGASGAVEGREVIVVARGGAK